MLVGAVPGAIVGGRLGYVLDHLDYYKAIPAAILDPLQGGFTLTLAVPLGVLTGAVIARLLGASVGRWLDVVAPPLLFVLAAGKLVGVLGGTGQGAATDLAWATAYGGPGPWASLAADVSSHPSQVYEAVLVAVAVAVLFRLARSRRFPQRAGATFAAALGLWAIARFVVAFTLRDPIVAGPLRMEQVLLLGVLLVAALGLAHRPRVTVIEPEFEPPTSPWIGGDPDAERMRDAPGEDAGEVEPGPA
jgi:phosphatidylglycerol:prolipoprotein diacylglycerol transferase